MVAINAGGMSIPLQDDTLGADTQKQIAGTGHEATGAKCNEFFCYRDTQF